MHSLPGSCVMRCAHAAPAASAAAEAVWLPCHGAGAFSPIMALSFSTPGLAPAPDGVELVRPATDDLLYRFVTLPNGLHALLVSDATADKAAAAVDVSGRRERVLGGAFAAARALQGPPRAAASHDRGAGWAGKPPHPPIALGRPPPPAAAARAPVPSQPRFGCGLLACHARSHVSCPCAWFQLCAESGLRPAATIPSASRRLPNCAAASDRLQVRVGSLSDPDDVPGLVRLQICLVAVVWDGAGLQQRACTLHIFVGLA